MTRRALFAALASLPFVGRLVRRPAPACPGDLAVAVGAMGFFVEYDDAEPEVWTGVHCQMEPNGPWRFFPRL